MAKRFINAPDDVVPELMQGLSLDASRVTLIDPGTGHAIAIRAALATNTQTPRVSVVSGGGSGHEPMAAGYIGEGMLAGAVAGGVFASPSVPAIATLLDTVAPLSTGLLVVVMNYQGDRLNFRRAVDELKKRSPAYPISMVIVGDDVALPGSPDPRGIAGTIFVLKVAGAAADQGRPLQEVINIAETAARSIASFGVALEPCTIPGHAVDADRLSPDEIELGMGIHGEPGAERQLIAHGAMSSITNDVIASVCRRLDAALQAKQELASRCTGLAVMVNNLGAVSQAEMLIVSKAVADFIFGADAHVINGKRYRVHMYCGGFMTSLQMTGVSISCFMIPSDNGHMDQLLHETTIVTAWNPGFLLRPPNERPVVLARGAEARRAPISTETVPNPAVYLSTPQPVGYSPRDAHYSGSPYNAARGAVTSVGGLSARTEKYIIAVTTALLQTAPDLAMLDRKTGDGDLGDTVRRGCDRIRADLDRGHYAQAAGNPSLLFKLMAASTGESMGGTSGVMTSIFLDAASQSFQRRPEDTRVPAWRAAFVDATHAVMEQGGAKVGDRTLVDALKPAADVLAVPGRSLAEAARAARVGCESTKTMTTARFGRSAHVRAANLLNQADPGAFAICVILDALVDAAFG